MINNGLRFDFVFPNFETWKDLFISSQLPTNDVDMEKYYNIIYGKYATRYLKWSNQSQAIGNMVPILVDSFFKYKNYLILYNKNYDQLLTNTMDDYAYGLPGDEDEITETNESKFLVAKGRKKQNPSNLEIIKQLGNLTPLMDESMNMVAKLFLPFVWPENGYSLI